jgi:hypothetical protein
MSDNEQIKDSISQLANKGNKQTTIKWGVVQSVDKTACTCTVKMNVGEMIKEDVKLRSVETNDMGLVIFPLKDSVVAVGNVENSNDNLMVLKYSEVESIQLKIKDVELSVKNTGQVDLKAKKVNLNADEIVINGGNNKGIVKVSELVAAVNRLEQFASTHIHTSAAPGSPTTTAVVPFNAVTQITDLENDKVKH